MKIFEVTAPHKTPTALSVRKALLTPKVLGLGVLKSLPVVANVIFACLAARDVVRGDWVGAGINLTGIFAGNLTQIATFAYDFARTQYAEQYYGEDAPPMILEKDMAADPERTKERLAHLKDLAMDVLQHLASETEQKAQQSAQAKKREFAITAGGAAVGNPNLKP